MRLAGIFYVIATITINFLIGSDETFLYALPSFPITVWLLTTRQKKKKPNVAVKQTIEEPSI